ncbi:hypothetical protein HELRODRAFT_163912 [Helobdella robusta]|uniref:Endonuclease/exonuclease/phosphatase domain-containing protein n=1 Tax=Helobdella robusta TaxID=6412 RepID=T1EUM1_HELRO|nr:hypothetical protein HELRODRAFT_163912 [Helobdella robusta]ESN96789.1 hypothetical protein HELRODRAFT_163912 [Helobdella robusta]
MASRPVKINELLYFVNNNLSLIEEESFINNTSEFYTSDDIVLAIKTLKCEIESLNNAQQDNILQDKNLWSDRVTTPVENLPFSLVLRKNKRPRSDNSSTNRSETDSNNANRQNNNIMKYSEVTKKVSNKIVGNKVSNDCKLKAEKQLIKKSFFMMSNIQRCHRDDVVEYFSTNGIKCTMFRVCVESCDASKMKDPDIILKHIIVPKFENINQFNNQFKQIHYNNSNIKSFFNLMHINIRSLIHKADELFDYLNNFVCTFDVVAITETWINDSTEDLICMNGFKFIGKNRLSKHGGGVGFYVSNNLTFKTRDDLNKLGGLDFETFAIELKTDPSTKNFVIVVSYRPPSCNAIYYLQQLEIILQQIDVENKHVVITGDLNIDMSDTNDDVNKMYLCQLFTCYSFDQLITLPTRISVEKQSIIDCFSATGSVMWCARS